jgi:PEGA domain
MRQPLLLLLIPALLSLAAAGQAPANNPSDNADKARVFITDSQSWEYVTSAGGAGGVFASGGAGGARPQTAEIVKTFGERCPQVVTNNKIEKSDYVVVLDHEGGKGVLRHRNKVAVFNRISGDAVVSKSTLSLGGSVQEACEALTRDWATHAKEIRAAEGAADADSPVKLVPAASTGTSAPPPISQQSQLQISSDPAGADIEVDGNYVGNTPSTVAAAAGQHEISIKKNGFKPWQRKITVSAGQINVVAQLEANSAPVSPASSSPSPAADNASAASLAKSQSQPSVSHPPASSPVLQPAVLKSTEQSAPVSSETTGTVSITSDPSGADIFVDSVGKGHAPALLKLPAGKHQVQLVLNGYKDWVSDVDVKGGSIVNVTGQLSK